MDDNSKDVRMKYSKGKSQSEDDNGDVIVGSGVGSSSQIKRRVKRGSFLISRAHNLCHDNR